MIKANDINRKSWIKYNEDSDFPIQNIPFGAFKLNNGQVHLATIIGDTVISLTMLEELEYFQKTSYDDVPFRPGIPAMLQSDIYHI